MVIKKSRTNSNIDIDKFTSLDKTQKGGVRICMPGVPDYENINVAIKDITSASKIKLIDLIFYARDRGSKQFGAFFRPGYRCLSNYLEGYYKLTTNTAIAGDARVINPKILEDMKPKNRYRILLGLIYLYLIKNISLNTNYLDAFYNKLGDAKKALEKDVVNNTAKASVPLTSDEKKDKKKDYYKNVVAAANTLIGEKLTSETSLIQEYDRQLKNIVAERAKFDTKSIEHQANTATTILEQEKAKAAAQARLVASTVVNMTEQQILDMRNQVGKGIMILLNRIKVYTGPKKAIYEKAINDINTDLQQLENTLVPTGPITPDQKMKLKEIDLRIASLRTLIDLSIKSSSSSFFSGSSSLYNMTGNEIDNEDEGTLVDKLNDIKFDQITIDEVLNSNIMRALAKLNRLVQRKLETYKRIKIENRYALLNQIITRDKITDYSGTVIDIITSFDPTEFNTYINDPTISDKIKKLLLSLDLNRINDDVRAKILNIVELTVLNNDITVEKIKQLFTFASNQAHTNFPIITSQKIILILNELDDTNFGGTSKFKEIPTDTLVLFRIFLGDFNSVTTSTRKNDLNTRITAAINAGKKLDYDVIRQIAEAGVIFTVDDVLNAAAAAVAAFVSVDVRVKAIAYLKALQFHSRFYLIGNSDNTKEQLAKIATQLYNIGTDAVNAGVTTRLKAYIKYAAVQAVTRGGTDNNAVPAAFNKNVPFINTRAFVAYVTNNISTVDDAIYGAKLTYNGLVADNINNKLTEAQKKDPVILAALVLIRTGTVIDTTAAIGNAPNEITAVEVAAAAAAATAAAPGAVALVATHVAGAGANINALDITMAAGANYNADLTFLAWTIITTFINTVNAITHTGPNAATKIIKAIAEDQLTFLRGGAKRSRHSKSKRHHKSKKHNTNNKKVSRKHRNLKSKYNSKSKKNNKNTKRRKSKHH